MPRLTNKTYLYIHHELRTTWNDDSSRLAQLTSREQAVLHDFFVPSQSIPDQDLLRYRQTVAKQHPALPHQAGKAWARLQRIQIGAEQVTYSRRCRAPPVRTSRRKRHNILVRSELRPDPDYTKVLASLKRTIHDDLEVLLNEADEPQSVEQWFRARRLSQQSVVPRRRKHTGKRSH